MRRACECAVREGLEARRGGEREARLDESSSESRGEGRRVSNEW